MYSRHQCLYIVLQNNNKKYKKEMLTHYYGNNAHWFYKYGDGKEGIFYSGSYSKALQDKLILL